MIDNIYGTPTFDQDLMTPVFSFGESVIYTYHFPFLGIFCLCSNYKLYLLPWDGPLNQFQTFNQSQLQKVIKISYFIGEVKAEYPENIIAFIGNQPNFDSITL